MFPKDTLQLLLDTGKALVPPQTYRVDGMPKNEVFHKNPDGTYRREVEPVARAAEFDDLNSFVRWVRSFDTSLPKTEIFVSYLGVAAFAGDRARSHSHIDVSYTPAFAWVESCEAKPITLDQKQILNLFKVQLRGVVDATLWGCFKDLKWEAIEQNNATLGGQQANIGRSLNAKVSGESSIPEETILSVNPLVDPQFGTPAVRVPLVIETDPVARKFILHIPPGTTEAMRMLVQRTLYKGVCELFEQTDPVEIYQGQAE